MIYIILALVACVSWIAYEMWRAPLLDDNHKVIKPAKKLKDLLKWKSK